ncbi:MAG: cobalamin biosynthesis protein CbiX [Betaproteobacteria bacterium]|nr:cobalamin biosynthesis protein CbiX [Betaproteobacteria bacterium]
MPQRHLILFAHGARDPEWARPLEALRERVATLAPDCTVTLAYLEFMSPGLMEAVATQVRAGAADITVVPVFLAQGGHLKRDLPLMLAELRAAHPAVALSVLPAIGEQPAVIEAIANCVAEVSGAADRPAGAR